MFMVIGKLLDRGYAAFNTLGATATILLLIDPNALDDPSFQMTFAAVLAVIGIGVPASQWALGWLRDALRVLTTRRAMPTCRSKSRIGGWRRVWCELRGWPTWVVRFPYKLLLLTGEALIVSLAVEMVFTVFMVESFHRLSPISPLLNIPAGIAAAIVTPLALLLVFLPGPAAAPIAWTITNLLDLLLKTLHLALQIPYATVRLPSPPVGVWVAYSLAGGALVLSIHKRWRPVCWVGMAAVLGLQLLIMFKDFSPAPPRVTTLTFLDIGQGDSTLIEFPSGYRMLVDGGGVASGRFLDLRDESTFSIGESVLSPYLFSRGIRRLDAIVVTHAHHDHMDGCSRSSRTSRWAKYGWGGIR